ncbi:SOS response-associated peptidase [Sphingomonas psychrotolerans]|uniref:Abasic site processing protein n=1 Tax=Sphingomonas psychrotolerans TaxID=1327635 RepID=A0ABU3N8C2_9SPHN|nr:SOS response-associated peptidase [Sphingomonas psychrotolerans]MDT8760526.1 SOS response-associated peptidase [Sphingomonas psychrotolerans]
MCNDYRLEVDIASIMEDFEELEIAIDTPEGKPNVAAREDIKITDVAPIVKSVEDGRGLGSLVNRRWSWPGPTGKPVYNYRAEGRGFTSRRCLILADGFYEFTKSDDPKQKRQNKWLFTLGDHHWFAIAGIWRPHETIGEAFTMLTLDAGQDVAPYHHRQVIPLGRDQWADWLDPGVPASKVLRVLPAGSLTVSKVHGAPPAAGVPLLL